MTAQKEAVNRNEAEPTAVYGQDGDFLRTTQSYDQDHTTDVFQSVPVLQSAPLNYWPYPPLSPLQAVTQPPSALPSPMMQGEYGSPYWHAISTDPSGQRFVVHPVNGYCPCAPIGVYSNYRGFPFTGLSNCPVQNQSSDLVEQGSGNFQQDMQQSQSANQSSDTQGEQVRATIENQVQHQVQYHTAAHMAGPPFGYAPHYFPPHPPCSSVAGTYTSLWPTQQQHQQHCHHQQQQMPFPEPAYSNGAHTYCGNHVSSKESEETMQNKVHIHGQSVFKGNPGPIQIPAVSSTVN